jgi:hypothetical protein
MRELEAILSGLILGFWTTLVDHGAVWRTTWGAYFARSAVWSDIYRFEGALHLGPADPLLHMGVSRASAAAASSTASG